MKRVSRLFLLLAVFTAVATASQSADKPAKETDERLAVKVTYEGGYKRLHGVVADLGAKSGVRLYCGNNARDWTARDIPIIVCAKDLPLGKLLRAIADASHTQFGVEKVTTADKDQLPSYRIYRTAKVAADIVNRIDARHAAHLAQAQWGWDTLVTYGQSGIDDQNVPSYVSLMSKMLASLDPGIRQKALSGNYLSLTSDDVSKPDLLRQLYLAGWKKQRLDKGAQKDPQPDDLQRAEIGINLQDGGDSGYTGLFSTCYYNIGEKGTAQWTGNFWLEKLDDVANKLKDVKGFVFPERPTVPELPKPEEEYPSDRLKILKSPQDWDLPSLKTKISLEAPPGKEHPTFSDAVIAIAKASGFSVVCEDFESHQNSKYNYGNGDPKFDTRVDGFFVKDTTLGDALKKLDCYKQVWFINEDDKLIVGWADAWRLHHRNLVQESTLNNIRTKLNASGVDLDDVTPIVNLTYEQTGEWFRNSHEFYELVWFNSYSDDVSAWRLYESLAGDDKQLAKSEAGLPLGKFDSDWLFSFFEQRRRKTPYYNETEATTKQIKADEELKDALFASPKTVSQLVLRVVKERGDTGSYVLVDKNGVETNLDATVQGTLDRYHIEIEGQVNGAKAVLTVPGPSYALPLLSQEKRKQQEASLRKLFEQGYTMKRK